MYNKMLLTAMLSIAMLPALGQTAKFGSISYEGRDARFDKSVDSRSQYPNPIVSGFYPDPTVLRVGDTYWLANSTFGWHIVAQGVDCQCLSKTYSGGFVGTTIGLYASLKNIE